METKYQVTYDEKCYDLASAFLEDEPGLFNHKNSNELAGVIQRAIEDYIKVARANYDGTAK